MKKQILLIAAALLLGVTACQKEDIAPMNNHQSDNIMVKSTADLIGTEWTLTMNLFDSVEFIGGGCGFFGGGCGFPEDDFNWDSIMGLDMQLQLGLSFDSTYAHISFPDDVTVLTFAEVDGEYTLEEIESMNFAYSYDPTTLTGSLTANTIDENGNPDTYQIPFTYDTTTDAIIINMEFAYGFSEDDTMTYQLVFHRNV
ncbi:MAG: hypothetical protein IJ785_01875 [Bacteroidales bacterium]|nr:hypothetical protein [Bacteroidales bacterium]